MNEFSKTETRKKTKYPEKYLRWEVDFHLRSVVF